MDPELNNSAPMEQFDDKKQQENNVVESTQNTETTDYSALSTADLLAEFERLIEAEDKTEMHKNADIIKSCFYKLLRKDQPLRKWRSGGCSSGSGKPGRNRVQTTVCTLQSFACRPFAQHRTTKEKESGRETGHYRRYQRTS